MEDWIGVKVAKNISKNVSGHDLLSPPWKRSHLGNLTRFFVTHCGKKIGEVRIIRMTLLTRGVVPGGAGCAMAHPYFVRSVNPFSTRGGQIMPS